MIRGGFYCGRRFNAQSHHAMWFLEEDELKIFDSAGQIVCSMHSSEIDRWARNAENEALFFALLRTLVQAQAPAQLALVTPPLAAASAAAKILTPGSPPCRGPPTSIWN